MDKAQGVLSMRLVQSEGTTDTGSSDNAGIDAAVCGVLPRPQVNLSGLCNGKMQIAWGLDTGSAKVLCAMGP